MALADEVALAIENARLRRQAGELAATAERKGGPGHSPRPSCQP